MLFDVTCVDLFLVVFLHNSSHWVITLFWIWFISRLINSFSSCILSHEVDLGLGKFCVPVVGFSM